LGKHGDSSLPKIKKVFLPEIAENEEEPLPDLPFEIIDKILVLTNRVDFAFGLRRFWIVQEMIPKNYCRAIDWASAKGHLNYLKYLTAEWVI
jgi:hypothetical protein